LKTATSLKKRSPGFRESGTKAFILSHQTREASISALATIRKRSVQPYQKLTPFLLPGRQEKSLLPGFPLTVTRFT